MMTVHILESTSENIAQATSYLKDGRLVAIPTETVYGLAANALSDDAVSQIYALKQRPQFNPLIIHCVDLTQAQMYGVFSDQALACAKAFWPGPLTLVLPFKKDSSISELARAGLETIALRISAHPIARALLEHSGLPLAAPSANPSERISPTSAIAVAEGFENQIMDAPLYILDGGACTVGLESTILDLTTDQPIILRPGCIAPEDLATILGQIPPINTGHDPKAPKSPGMLKRHYAPQHPLRINVEFPMAGQGFLNFGPTPTDHAPTLNLSLKGDLKEAAANLFAYLKSLDKENIQSIAVAPIPETGIGLAINDRLKRATTSPQALGDQS